MNGLPSYVTSLLRVVGAFIAGWLVSKGYITADQVPELGGAALTVIAALWAVVHTAKTRSAMKAAIAAPAGKAA